MAHRVLSDQDDLCKRVLRLVRKKKRCDLDELVQECTSHTWMQVYLEVDRLSLKGDLCLFCKKAGEYTVTLPRAA
jgi:hypothetical protein